MFRLNRLKLTRPDGVRRVVVVDQLVDWTEAIQDQKPHIDAVTQVTTTGGMFFVRETADEISQLVKTYEEK